VEGAGFGGVGLQVHRHFVGLGRRLDQNVVLRVAEKREFWEQSSMWSAIRCTTMPSRSRRPRTFSRRPPRTAARNLSYILGQTTTLETPASPAGGGKMAPEAVLMRHPLHNILLPPQNFPFS
jgi:hypothetical protein